MLIKKITPGCLASIKKKFNLTHIVMWCMSDEGQYILTTGDNADHSVQAAILGNKLKTHFGWPKMSMAIAPKLTEAYLEIKKLKEENERLKKLLGVKTAVENKENIDEGNEK